jgi:hypothetical protein
LTLFALVVPVFNFSKAFPTPFTDLFHPLTRAAYNPRNCILDVEYASWDAIMMRIMHRAKHIPQKLLDCFHQAKMRDRPTKATSFRRRHPSSPNVVRPPCTSCTDPSVSFLHFLAYHAAKRSPILFPSPRRPLRCQFLSFFASPPVLHCSRVPFLSGTHLIHHLELFLLDLPLSVLLFHDRVEY